MYKCLDCGNTEKFIGTAQEKGKAEISLYGQKYHWCYQVSDTSWKSGFKIETCFYCHSKNIVKL